MPRFEYQFDTRIDDRSRRFKKRLRIVLLFLLVSAITAVGIWLLIPKIDKNQEQKTDNESAVVSNNENSQKTESDGKIENSGVVESKENNVVKSLDNNTLSQQTAEKTDNNNLSSSDENSQPTALPEKGKVWAGDPAVDTPAVSQNKIVPSKLDELKYLLSKFEYNSLTEKALDIMLQENEGSENYRLAAKYLLEARVAQLSSNIGVPGISYSYIIRGGDTLSHIARRNKTTVAGLMKYNRLSNGFIRIGRKFIIHRGGWSISVSKSNRLLKLYNDVDSKRPFAVFEVGVGRLNSTPAGGFVISGRIKSPSWHAPDGSVFAPGDPGNELGNYFLKLAATGNPDRPITGYGIHGTPNESTVGKSLSSGCIRMRNADVELLYNLVPEKTPVNITE